VQAVPVVASAPLLPEELLAEPPEEPLVELPEDEASLDEDDAAPLLPEELEAPGPLLLPEPPESPEELPEAASLEPASVPFAPAPLLLEPPHALPITSAAQTNAELRTSKSLSPGSNRGRRRLPASR
jgi:hypothetical protein